MPSITAALVTAALACGGAPTAHAATRDRAVALQSRSLRALSADSGLVMPVKLDQRLLICNAYPSSSPLVAKLDGKAAPEAPIGYSECRDVGASVKPGDRLALSLGDAGISGTFQVGELPPTDAELLVVPYKKKGSSLIRFQSFAFPTRADGKDAQLALLDTFAGNGTDPRLRMEDFSFATAPKKTSARKEDLVFDRVYTIEAGLYSAVVEAKRQQGAEAEEEERNAPKALNFLKDQSYVLIRAGGEEQSGFPESLMVFPETPMPPPPAPVVVKAAPTAPPQSFLSRLLTRLFGHN